MTQVCAVSNDALNPPDAAGLVDVLWSGVLGADEPLCSHSDALESFPLLCGGTRVPDRDAVCEN